jgi:4'-phosphopantetheinyl transferase
MAWSEIRELYPLKSADLHVWLAHLPSEKSHLVHLVALLSPDEQERAARFRFDEHRERWQMARGLLRTLLGTYLAVSPESLRFTYGEHGKPLLPDTGIYFNTSHSGDYAVFAFTRAGQVGVDVERIKEDISRREEIARKYFAPGEFQQWQTLPESERVRGFFDVWTRKEAFIKARGDGIFCGLDQFETSSHGPRIVSVRGEPATNWWISNLPEIPGYAASVVVNAAACTPHFWRRPMNVA